MWVMILHHRVLAQISRVYSILCVRALIIVTRAGQVNRRMFSFPPGSVHLQAVKDEKVDGSFIIRVRRLGWGNSGERLARADTRCSRNWGRDDHPELGRAPVC